MNHFHPIAQCLEEYGLDAMLLTGEANRFYASGFASSDGIVLVTRGKSYFVTDSRYIEAAKKNVVGADVYVLGRGATYVKALRQLVQKEAIHRLGFEEAVMSVLDYQRYSKVPCTFVEAQKLPSMLRRSKDEEEIEAMKKAQRITEGALERMLPLIRPGVSEKELAARLSFFLLEGGGEKNAFDPIVVSGPNSSMPHGVPTERKLEPGDFVTMDFGCVSGGYCSDMTRTVAVGYATEEMKTVYALVRKAQEAGIAAVKAETSGKEIDAAARKVIDGAGYGAYFGHSFGHSVGIEIHESPNFSPSEPGPVPAGAVVSAEPGIYLPGKFGVRIEDVVIVRRDGCEDITNAPKDLLILG
ncbi:MAG: Xaa-Pro peptidase family protein [Oscillospiraceae bacterium]|nr:Xaa-Pro peptidase family protein [Oscillospiraceae bacterium]